MTHFELQHGDCREQLKTLADNSIDSIVTDPPYELGFMGKSWDSTGIAYDVTVWQECLRVLKPGGHLLAFGGSRTYHRLASAVEDAGFEIRDQIMWIYGSGFPKSLDVSKAIDKRAGAERTKVPATGGLHKNTNLNDDGWAKIGTDSPVMDSNTAVTDEAKQWQGFGTALKPAHEPIVMARKPLIGTVALNVLTHGTGGINIDGCRVGYENQHDMDQARVPQPQFDSEMPGVAYNFKSGVGRNGDVFDPSKGRWPANVIHDGSDEVIEHFPQSKGQQGDVKGTEPSHTGDENTTCYGEYARVPAAKRGDTGSAARFFYSAKTSKKDRGEGNIHSTVKPTELMRYLCRLVTPPGGKVLDPFMGSGSTGKAAVLEGFQFVGIEKEDSTEQPYLTIARGRITAAAAEYTLAV